jgi:asparagine synthetase B (glutamine-hydrolysing)
MGVEVVVVKVGEEDFRDALPDVIRCIETPLYNLHPVAKLLLARALRADGIELALTGDGADHVFGHDFSADYLPLVQDLCHAGGVELRSPFLDERVVAHGLAAPPDSEKRALRRLAATLPVPDELVVGPKLTRLAPPIDLAGVVMPQAITELARRLGRAAPATGDDREHVRWTTLALLVDTLGAS